MATSISTAILYFLAMATLKNLIQMRAISHNEHPLLHFTLSTLPIGMGTGPVKYVWLRNLLAWEEASQPTNSFHILPTCCPSSWHSCCLKQKLPWHRSWWSSIVLCFSGSDMMLSDLCAHNGGNHDVESFKITEEHVESFGNEIKHPGVHSINTWNMCRSRKCNNQQLDGYILGWHSKPNGLHSGLW